MPTTVVRAARPGPRPVRAPPARAARRWSRPRGGAHGCGPTRAGRGGGRCAPGRGTRGPGAHRDGASCWRSCRLALVLVLLGVGVGACGPRHPGGDATQVQEGPHADHLGRPETTGGAVIARVGLGGVVRLLVVLGGGGPDAELVPEP